MLTKPIAAALAALGHELRPGWNEPGLMAALGKVASRNEFDVAMALVRFCADPAAQTPGAFPNPTGPHWTERVSPAATGRRNPPRDEECRTHAGQWRVNCGGCQADKRAVRDADETTRAGRRALTRAAALAEARQGLAEARAAQCRHGAQVCKDCQRTLAKASVAADLEATP